MSPTCAEMLDSARFPNPKPWIPEAPKCESQLAGEGRRGTNSAVPGGDPEGRSSVPMFGVSSLASSGCTCFRNQGFRK